MKRRDFLRQSALIGAGFSFLPWYQNQVRSNLPAAAKSRVIEITGQHLRQGNSFDQDVLAKMLDQTISHLYQSDQVNPIWKNLFSPRDVVGLKVNCLSGAHASTHPILTEIVIEHLREAGIPAGNIIIWDRMNHDLESAGYKINIKNRNKVLCFGNDAAGFDDRLYMNGSVGSLITRTLTRMCTAVINLPVLKDHGIVGVTLSMKNFFGAIHNPNKYHHNGGNPYVADLYELDVIRRKTRLTICDALDAQYEGGPPFKPQWSWPMNSLLVAVDGVALDRTGWDIIEAKRHEMGFPSLKENGRSPEYILTAGRKNLGQANPDLIDWQKISLS
jgi:uncharacterized protein (DUF362 family)